MWAAFVILAQYQAPLDVRVLTLAFTVLEVNEPLHTCLQGSYKNTARARGDAPLQTGVGHTRPEQRVQAFIHNLQLIMTIVSVSSSFER